MIADLQKNGATACIVALVGGFVKSDQGEAVKVDFAPPAAGSILFDGLFAGNIGKSADLLIADAKAKIFVAETYKHCKPIGILDGGQSLLLESLHGIKIKLDGDFANGGVVVVEKATSIEDFEAVFAKRRFHTRSDVQKVMV